MILPSGLAAGAEPCLPRESTVLDDVGNDARVIRYQPVVDQCVLGRWSMEYQDEWPTVPGVGRRPPYGRSATASLCVKGVSADSFEMRRVVDAHRSGERAVFGDMVTLSLRGEELGRVPLVAEGDTQTLARFADEVALPELPEHAVGIGTRWTTTRETCPGDGRRLRVSHSVVEGLDPLRVVTTSHYWLSFDGATTPGGQASWDEWPHYGGPSTGVWTMAVDVHDLTVSELSSDVARSEYLDETGERRDILLRVRWMVEIGPGPSYDLPGSEAPEPR